MWKTRCLVNINDQFSWFANENKTEHNSKWPYIPDDPYIILIIGGWGSGKTNALLNLINNQSDIDKICFYAKDRTQQKRKHRTKRFNDPNAFIEYLNDVYKNDEEYNIDKVVKILLRLKKNAVLNLTLF